MVNKQTCKNCTYVLLRDTSYPCKNCKMINPIAEETQWESSGDKKIVFGEIDIGTGNQDNNLNLGSVELMLGKTKIYILAPNSGVEINGKSKYNETDEVLIMGASNSNFDIVSAKSWLAWYKKGKIFRRIADYGDMLNDLDKMETCIVTSKDDGEVQEIGFIDGISWNQIRKITKEVKRLRKIKC